MREHRPAIPRAAFFLAFLIFSLSGCAPPAEVAIHYLGHASFVLEFGDGTTVLTDFGQSNAYDLDSPIHGLGGVVPDVHTISHDHADHSGGRAPEGIGVVLDNGQSLRSGDLSITAIPTYERSLTTPDNFSYLFEFRGIKILHLGDCQSLMLGFSKAMLGPDGWLLSTEQLAELIRETYPDTYDLVLLPIGFTREITAEAAAFAEYLDARTIVPMHFWNEGERDAFLARMADRRDGSDRPYRSHLSESARMVVTPAHDPTMEIEVVALSPAPFPSN